LEMVVVGGREGGGGLFFFFTIGPSCFSRIHNICIGPSISREQNSLQDLFIFTPRDNYSILSTIINVNYSVE
jgi:hypothetical protein